MGSPSAFLVISFLVLVACSLSAATRDFQKPFVKEKTVSKTSQVLKRPASVPLDFQPTEKRERSAGEEEFSWNAKYFTKDIIREPDNIYWHKNEKLHPMPQLSKEIVPEEKRGSTDGGEEFLRNRKYFTKDIIREPDNIYWYKNEKVHPMPETTKELPSHASAVSPGAQKIVEYNNYFTKDLIREPDFTWWHKNGKP